MRRLALAGVAFFITATPALGITSFVADARSDRALAGATSNHVACSEFQIDFELSAGGRVSDDFCRPSGDQLIRQAIRARARFLAATPASRPTVACASFRTWTLAAYRSAVRLGRSRTSAAIFARGDYGRAEFRAERLERQCRR